MNTRGSRLLAGLIIVATTNACRAIPRTEPPNVSIWTVAAPGVMRERDSASRANNTYPDEGGLIVLDSASLRPSLVNRGGSGGASDSHGDTIWLEIDLERYGVVTTYQGGRYRPETIRAIATDSLALDLAARAIAVNSRQAGTRLIVDFQGSTSEDIHGLVEMVRAIGEFTRRMGIHPLGIVLPPGDTVSYPTEVLARVADLLVLRLHGEHRPGTARGPLTSEEFIAREIGHRSRVAGTSKLVAELPLYGYRWNRDGTAVAITWSEAQALVLAETGTFRRDPATQFLTATGRDGWTIWIPDAATVAALVSAVRKRGVNQILLAGPIGADPVIESWRREQFTRRSGPSDTRRE